MFRRAVAAVHPDKCVPQNLPPPPKGRTVVVGAGKAAAAMAAAVEKHWRGELSGLVVTRYGHGANCRRIEVAEAGHPVPDQAGVEAAQRMLALVQGLSPDDLVLVLISGGGSALLTLPAPGITLADKQAVTRALLKSGAPISAINCVRKHLSAIKGGRLALAAYPARVVTLIISDIPADDASTVASGPTIGDPTTREGALAILDQYVTEIPASITAYLNDPKSETPKPGDPRLAGAEIRVIAKAKDALEEAARAAEAAGYKARVLGDAIEGEASDVGVVHAALSMACREGGVPLSPPCVLISGGETTVTVKGEGKGGRNAEFLLAVAIALDGAEGISGIACDTDGIDGTETNAGALVAPDTLQRARAAGVDAKAYLARNDAYSYFEALGDLVVTGPTRTNVNDFRALLIEML
ncbi:MAG TPA: glycerate kinase [Micropepsaceae bacterium]|nr:glycerate kinase [Micropepsaceae bacterium]